MKPLKLNSSDLYKWRSKTWQEYAAETRQGKRIRLLCNYDGSMRVTVDNNSELIEIWKGKKIEIAVEKFMTALSELNQTYDILHR